MDKDAIADRFRDLPPDSDLAHVRALVLEIGTAFKAAEAINAHLTARGYDYRVARSTIDSMHNRGKGRPAMIALVRCILEQMQSERTS